MTATGLALKYTVARSSEEIRHTLAIVVPFVLLRGDVMLGLDAKELEAEQEPSIPVSRQDSIESEPVQTTPNEEEKKPSYAFLPAEENYFDSVLFIGDSRTVGLALYGRLGKADYFADVGMSLFNLLDKKISDTGFASQDLKTLLQTKKYYAIYLMLGINEVGYPMQSIEKKLQSVLDEISTMQPDALIVLQANLGVTQEKETKNPQLSMDRIRTLNDTIKSYADEEKKIFYLDVNPVFADEVEYKNWAAWLKEHAIQEKIT
jgi:lysophospholipase L1-like esterase